MSKTNETYVAVTVTVMESEAGWGQRVDDYMVCLNNQVADDWRKEFNSKNDKAVVPDWYMYAESGNNPIDITAKQFKKLQKEKRMWLSTLKTIA